MSDLKPQDLSQYMTKYYRLGVRPEAKMLENSFKYFQEFRQWILKYIQLTSQTCKTLEQFFEPLYTQTRARVWPAPMATGTGLLQVSQVQVKSWKIWCFLVFIRFLADGIHVQSSWFPRVKLLEMLRRASRAFIPDFRSIQSHDIPWKYPKKQK